MARNCTICVHKERETIDAALLNSEPYRSIAERFSVSPAALSRHTNEHLSAAVERAQEAVQAQTAQIVKEREASELGHALDVVQQLTAINTACWQVLKQARDANDPAMVLRAADRVLRQVELQAKLLGDLQQEGTVNIALSVEWVTVRMALTEALAPFPEARVAVAAALARLDHAA